VSQKPPASICELGCGSGIIGISLALTSHCNNVYLADINPRAIAAAQANARQHQVQDRVKVLESNLFEKIPRGIKFDLILFNPPYLPASGELESLEVQQQTEGGTSGLEVTRLFLEMLPPFLQKTGVVNFIASSLSPLSDLEAICKKEQLHLERAKSIHIFFEDIVLFEVSFIK
jgi:HemK-related putative methylase